MPLRVRRKLCGAGGCQGPLRLRGESGEGTPTPTAAGRRHRSHHGDVEAGGAASGCEAGRDAGGDCGGPGGLRVLQGLVAAVSLHHLKPAAMAVAGAVGVIGGGVEGGGGVTAVGHGGVGGRVIAFQARFTAEIHALVPPMEGVPEVLPLGLIVRDLRESERFGWRHLPFSKIQFIQ